MPSWNIRLLETIEEMTAVEALQREVWPGSETDVVPAHLLITAVHNGGLVLGAFLDESPSAGSGERLVGFVFGFPGLEFTPDGPRPKHCSHIAGVYPEYRDGGVGFALKRAQWQVVRHQGLDHVTWTYDPLLSRNAYLNIARLGAVCSNYRRSEYGDMRDEFNAGLPSDRFQVDWWINTRRVERRLSGRPRPALSLDHLARVGMRPLYSLQPGPPDLPRPPEHVPAFAAQLIAAEIPPDFLSLKSADFSLARDWRFFTREFFETAFAKGYLVTDFVFDTSESLPRSFYILTDGESTLEG
jgi:predicted GNAT superfamily acetyltransferase